MNCWYRFAINLIVIILISCFYVISPVYSLPSSNQFKANDFLQMGAKNIQLGNYRKAVKDFTQAIELKSDFNLAYSNRCLANLQLEEYHNALADCTIALSFVPDNTEAYLNRGLAEYRLGNYQAAVLDNNQAIKLKPYDFRAYYNRGIANAALKNHQGAIQDYNLALTQTSQLSTSASDIYNDRGLVNLELQNLQAALLDFSKAIRLNSADDRAYFNWGCACAKNKDNWGALRDFNEVVKLNPSSAIAYVNRGVAYHNLGYSQAAIKDLQTAAAYFIDRKETIAYQRTVKLIETVQRQVARKVEIANRLGIGDWVIGNG